MDCNYSDHPGTESTVAAYGHVRPLPSWHERAVVPLAAPEGQKDCKGPDTDDANFFDLDPYHAFVEAEADHAEDDHSRNVHVSVLERNLAGHWHRRIARTCLPSCCHLDSPYAVLPLH